MAVQERQYVDPTAGAIQALLNLGGTSGSSTATAGADPRAIASIQQILDQQMQGTTPEGAAELLRAIFSQGMAQVPGLATTYGQAAGARTSNNSPFKLALQDMMLKLTQEGARQLGSNQQAASNTAKNFADATRSETRTNTTKPKGSAMQLLPFALANAGKVKKLFDEFGNKVSDSSGIGVPAVGSPGFGVQGFGAPVSGGFDFGSGSVDFGGGSGSDAIDFGGGMDFSSGVSFDDWGSSLGDTNFFDAGNIFDGGFDGGGFDLGVELFADGGLVETGKKQRSSRQQQIEDAIIKGEGGSTSEKEAPSKDSDKPSDYKPNKSVGVKIIELFKGKGFANGGLVTRKAPGYADGGSVRRKSEDVRAANDTYNLRDYRGREVRGITYNDVDGMLSLRGLGREGAPGSGGRGSARPQYRTIGNVDAGSSGVNDGTTSGQVGTPAENSAAIAGALGLGLSAVTGLPAAAISMAMNALGVPNSSMSPISQTVNALMSALGIGGNAEGQSSVTAEGVAEATGIAGANNGGLGGMGISMGLDAGFDPSAANSGVDGGSSSGGSDGVGDAASAGVGGGGFKSGGEVDGPGTGTSDSILARLSDGEYVIPADVVQALGVDFFDELRNTFHTPVNKMQTRQPSRGRATARSN